MSCTGGREREREGERGRERERDCERKREIERTSFVFCNIILMVIHQKITTLFGYEETIFKTKFLICKFLPVKFIVIFQF